MKCIISLIILSVFFINPINAQKRPNIKFGQVSPEQFTIDNELIDSNTNAIIIADIGSSEFVGNNKGWFSLVFKKTTRIKILNSKGYDAGNIDIFLYSDGNATERIEDLKATTYNLENGIVVPVKLDTKDVFNEKVRNNLIKTKFTFPGLTEGSILEYSYTIKSDFIFNLQPWEFQGEYPVLWSEYEVAFPDFFRYTTLSQGYLPFINYKDDVVQKNWSVRYTTSDYASQTYNFSGSVTYKKWAIQNAPPLKEEAYTTTINNHICKIEFQLSQYRLPNQPVEDIMGNWQLMSYKLQKRDDFGIPINKPNNWLDAEIKMIVLPSDDAITKAKKIFTFVRDNFKCTNDYGIFLSSSTTLKDVFNKRSGTVSDINLLLIAMLKHESIVAEPVLLSLRNRGLVHAIYPLLDRFNYLICEVNIGENQFYYLDASKPYLGFNKLSPASYNGISWIMSKEPVSMVLLADSIMEKSMNLMFISNDENGKPAGNLNSLKGYYDSYALREQLKPLSPKEYVGKLKPSFSSDIEVKSVEVDSLFLYDYPIAQRIGVKVNLGEEDIYYCDPMFGMGFRKNPFKSDNRYYPVEMPYAFDDSYVLSMEIPKGYVIDEIPKSVRVKLNDNEGSFEYLISVTGNTISLRSRILIKKASFAQEDYNSLRDFFSFIVKKHAEQIVFKKAE